MISRLFIGFRDCGFKVQRLMDKLFAPRMFRRPALLFYCNIENLALWTRSEIIGCAVTLRSGMMEYWSDGIMGLAEWDLILWG